MESSGPAEAPRRGFWTRRVVEPVKALLTQGITPGRIAGTLATGAVCSLFPFFGFTSLLNLGVGLWWRMNQPILQMLNQLLGPVQVAMIFLYVRMGERIWRAETLRFSLNDMTSTFHEDGFMEFLRQFGWAGIHAFTSWALTAPILFGVVYVAVNPLMRRWAKALDDARNGDGDLAR